MTDTMREKFEKRFSGIVWANITHKNCAWAGYQAAQADARALVGELSKALKDAHFELNAIRARDGAPQHIDWCAGRPLQTSSCTHEWFDTVVQQCDEALTKAQAFMEGKQALAAFEQPVQFVTKGLAEKPYMVCETKDGERFNAYINSKIPAGSKAIELRIPASSGTGCEQPAVREMSVDEVAEIIKIADDAWTRLPTEECMTIAHAGFIAESLAKLGTIRVVEDVCKS